MNAPTPSRRGWPRALALVAAVVVLLALAAATFTLSYSGIHAIALRAGVSPRLARVYPGLLDAALVIACLAAVLLRDGRWWARSYAWLAIIVIVAVGAGTNALHAMNMTLPQRRTAGVVAVVPWALLLLAFSLWVSVLRRPRARSRSRSGASVAAPETAIPAPPRAVPGVVAGQAASPAVSLIPAVTPVVTPPAPAPAEDVPAEAVPVAETVPAPAEPDVDAEPDVMVEPDEPGIRAGQDDAEAAEAAPEAETESTENLPAPEETVTVAETEAAGPSVPAEAPVTTRPSSLRRDYWDVEEEDAVHAATYPLLSAPTDTRTSGTVPTEVHHSLSDIASGDPRLPTTSNPRLNRLRSAPIPPEENTEEQS